MLVFERKNNLNTFTFDPNLNTKTTPFSGLSPSQCFWTPWLVNELLQVPSGTRPNSFSKGGDPPSHESATRFWISLLVGGAAEGGAYRAKAKAHQPNHVIWRWKFRVRLWLFDFGTVADDSGEEEKKSAATLDLLPEFLKVLYSFAQGCLKTGELHFCSGLDYKEKREGWLVLYDI